MDSMYHKVIADPRVRQIGVPVLGACLGLLTLRYINGWMSQRALNHYTANSKWDWNKEVVVITGGSSGIGEKVVERLAKRGIKVLILDQNRPKASLPACVHFYQVDITSETAVAETAAEIRTEHGDPTVLINNAGVGSDELLLDKSMADIRKLFDINFFAHISLIKEFLPAMLKNNHGHIVTTASLAAYSPRSANVDYGASKAAVSAMNDGLGLELTLYHRANRVRQTIVYPAWVRTPMLDRLVETGKFKSPTTKPGDVADGIVRQLYSGNSGQVYVPSAGSILTGIKGWPDWLQEKLRVFVSEDCKEAVLAVNADHGKKMTLGRKQPQYPSPE